MSLTVSFFSSRGGHTEYWCDWSSDVCSSDLPPAGILYGPAKAANAGGVATSGLEMSQNSTRLSWTRAEVDDRLHKIMIAIHDNCFRTAEKYGTPGNLVNGANIGGFLKVADSMLDQGLV